MKKLFFVLLAFVVLASCAKEEKDVTLTEGTSTSQTVYANETSKTDGIKFNAVSEWEAKVSEIAVNRAASQDDLWLRLSIYKGGAGNQSITMIIDPNTTGVDRKAEIKIICGNTIIIITVEQKAVTQGGETPEPASIYITAAGKITGGEILGDKLPVELRWMISRMDEEDVNTVSPEAVAYAAGKNWSLTLPTPDSNTLGQFHSAAASMGPIIIPTDAKFAGGDVTYAFIHGAVEKNMSLELTNISFENLKKGEDYRKKKGEGYVRFVYANKDVVVDEILKYPGDIQTFNFDNCRLRKGWNELVMVAEMDAAADGTVTINVTANNATSDFKWVAQGGEIPSSDKLITKIEVIDNRTDGVRGSQLTEFFYDDSNRVNKIVVIETEIEGVGSAEKTTTWISTGIITYASNTVSYNWTQTENGVPHEDGMGAGEITLDNNGRAISGKGSYLELKSQIKETEFTYLLEYTTNGYLAKSESIRSYKPNETWVEKLTWENGNLTQVRWGDDYIDKAIYGNVLNKTNLDLNWLPETGLPDTEGFAFACGDSQNIFPLLGYVGKRAKNLVEQLSYGYKKETDFSIKYSYTVDADGYPTMIEQSYKKYSDGNNNQSFEWVKGMPYKITYNK